MQWLHEGHCGEIFTAELSLNQSGLFALRQPLMLQAATDTIPRAENPEVPPPILHSRFHKDHI